MFSNSKKLTVLYDKRGSCKQWEIGRSCCTLLEEEIDKKRLGLFLAFFVWRESTGI